MTALCIMNRFNVIRHLNNKLYFCQVSPFPISLSILSHCTNILTLYSMNICVIKLRNKMKEKKPLDENHQYQ